MSRRELPERRENTRYSLKIHHAGQRVGVYVELGFYNAEKTEIGEIFLVMDKTGGTERYWVDSVARALSYAIQYGAPIEELLEKWILSKAMPYGPVSGHPRVKFCTSPLDLVARVILVDHCGREELAHGNAEAVAG